MFVKEARQRRPLDISLLQHYVSGGQIVHVSNQPLAVKGIIINMMVTEQQTEAAASP